MLSPVPHVGKERPKFFASASTIAQSEGTRVFVAAGSSLAVPECAEPQPLPCADTPPLSRADTPPRQQKQQQQSTVSADKGRADRRSRITRGGDGASGSAETVAAADSVPSGTARPKPAPALEQVRSPRSRGAAAGVLSTAESSRTSAPAKGLGDCIPSSADGCSRTRRNVAEDSEAEAIARISTLLDDAKYARHSATLSSMLVRNGVQTIHDLAELDFSLLGLEKALLPSKAVCDNLRAMARTRAADQPETLADVVGTDGAVHAEPEGHSGRRKRRAETIEDASQVARASRQHGTQPDELATRRTRR